MLFRNDVAGFKATPMDDPIFYTPSIADRLAVRLCPFGKVAGGKDILSVWPRIEFFDLDVTEVDFSFFVRVVDL